MIKYCIFPLIVFFFASCSSKQVLESKSATIIFKTKQMQYYDKGFITKYSDRINLSIFSFGQVALQLDIYPNRICESSFKCLSSQYFNNKYLSSSYKENFLYTLFQNDNINFKDKKIGVKIKVINE